MRELTRSRSTWTSPPLSVSSTVSFELRGATWHPGGTSAGF